MSVVDTLERIEAFVPPHSVEAEQSVLGAVMFDPSNFDKLAAIVSAESFFSSAHRLVWKAIERQCSRHRACDVITVHNALREAGEDVGGLEFLNACVMSAPSGQTAVRHAHLIRDKRTQREIIEQAHKAIEVARGPGDTSEKLEQIALGFASLERGQMSKAPRAFSELMIDAIDRYTALSEGSGPKAWATGISVLDSMLTGGLRPGKVYGIAARPSVGKSSAARSIAAHLAGQGHCSLILSQEMPVDEVADCLVAQIGGIDGSRLMSGQLSDERRDWARVVEVAEQAKDLPLYVDDDGGLTIQQIAAKARMVRGLKVLFLDYLQLSQSTNTKASTNDQVAEISKGLKRLALNQGIAVVVLSQLNRDVEKRADKEPVLADLRDSGAIEQDLDVAILLWTAMEQEGDDTRLVGWKVAKNRAGRKGTFAMRFKPDVYAWYPSSEPLRQQSTGIGKSSFKG